jgi:large subunit ribosomal protein L32
MRRSHHALVEPRLSSCECGAFHLRHRACQECGKYRGKQVVDVVARTERMQKRAKRKEDQLKSSGAPTENTTTKQDELPAPKEKKTTKKATDKRKEAKETKVKREA